MSDEQDTGPFFGFQTPEEFNKALSEMVKEWDKIPNNSPTFSEFVQQLREKYPNLKIGGDQ